LLLVDIARAITKGEYKSVKTEGSKRSVPIPKSAVKFFQDQIELAEAKGSEFLFSFENGVRLNDIKDIRGRRDRSGQWYNIVKKAGIEYKQLRQTRHTFAVQAIKSSEYTLQEISAILGHTSLMKILLVYMFMKMLEVSVFRCLESGARYWI